MFACIIGVPDSGHHSAFARSLPALLGFAPGLFLVVCHGQPLQVFNCVSALALERNSVIYFPTWTR